MKVATYDDATRFLNRARAHLEKDIARNQLILGVAGTVAEQPDVYPAFHAWVVEDGPIRIVASWTPPHNLIIGDSDSDEAIEALADHLQATGVVLPGVIGNRPTVDRFARTLAAVTGTTPRVEMGQGVFSLQKPEQVGLSAGRMREAGPDDARFLIRWWTAFAVEAMPSHESPKDEAAVRVEQRLDPRRSQGISLWDVDGVAVSMSGYAPVSGSVRIGPVYTPPELRGRGYATSLVAEQGRRFLEGGVERCLLYTDLANPTSNAIYERVGYHRVAESMVYEFDS